MLLTQKAFAEGNRALAAYCMKLVDVTLYGDDAAENSTRKQSLHS